MSDTTAYLAGCATTGVAALVLLVARMGMVSATSQSDRTAQLGDRIERIEAAAPNQRAELAEAQADQKLEFEIRRELDKQKELTKKLETQLAEQEGLSDSLEAQLKTQDERTKELLTRITDYQRAVEDMELEDKIAAAARPVNEAPRAQISPSLIWLGASAVVVLILGGGGLILCAVVLILQAQRRPARPAPMPPPMPMPPASGYRYYDQTFLPPAQFRPKRPTYYDYPPSPYDYPP